MLDKCQNCPYFEPCLSDMGWCNKVGGRICVFGSCTDYQILTNHKHKSNKKKSTKREREDKHRKRLKELSQYTYMISKYVDEQYVKGYGFYPIEKPYYKRLYLSNGCKHTIGITKYTKRKCNRAVRRYKGEISNGSHYKKISEYWWEIY